MVQHFDEFGNDSVGLHASIINDKPVVRGMHLGKPHYLSVGDTGNNGGTNEISRRDKFRTILEGEDEKF